MTGGGIIDAVVGGACGEEGAVGVLGPQHGENGLDVEAVKGAFVGQGGLLVADVEGAVVQPDIGFDGDGASSEGGVEGYRSPVVVVRVKVLRDDALGEGGRIGVFGVLGG